MAGDNFDLAKWSDITPINDGAECDITQMKVAVFSFDLDAWETRCATVTGCTFVKTDYEPYAVGILWKQLGITACDANGPYIMTKPGPPPSSSLPFEGLYWRHDPNAVEVYYNVTYGYNSSTFSFEFGVGGTEECADFQFLEGCFADLREHANDPNEWNLSFSLLESTQGLDELTNHSICVLWDIWSNCGAAGSEKTFALKWNTFEPFVEPVPVVPVVPVVPDEEEPKWYESKTI